MLTEQYSILLIDDDNDVLDAYTTLLEQAGYPVFSCNNPLDSRDIISPYWPGIVLSDVCMPECSGIELMELFHQTDKQLPVLLITGHGDIPLAVEAVKKGATDFLQKPVEPEHLLALVAKALQYRQSVIARRLSGRKNLESHFAGKSEWANRLRQQLQQLAETSMSVWFYGESGTGRTFAARQLHILNTDADAPLIAGDAVLSVPAPVDEWVEKASGGTLLLHNPENLDRQQQHKVAFLQNTEHKPFRLIAVSERPATELAVQGKITAELYHCFALTQLGFPPLTQRPDDIEPLFYYYLQKACIRLNIPVPEISADLLKTLVRRSWPNNVRELANAAELFAVGIFSPVESLNPETCPGQPTALDLRVEEYERQIIAEALNIHQGRINEVAEYLLIPRKKLYLRMKKYELNKEQYKSYGV